MCRAWIVQYTASYRSNKQLGNSVDVKKNFNMTPNLIVFLLSARHQKTETIYNV